MNGGFDYEANDKHYTAIDGKVIRNNMTEKEIKEAEKRMGFKFPPRKSLFQRIFHL